MGIPQYSPISGKPISFTFGFTRLTHMKMKTKGNRSNHLRNMFRLFMSCGNKLWSMISVETHIFTYIYIIVHTYIYNYIYIISIKSTGYSTQIQTIQFCCYSILTQHPDSHTFKPQMEFCWFLGAAWWQYIPPHNDWISWMAPKRKDRSNMIHD